MKPSGMLAALATAAIGILLPPAAQAQVNRIQHGNALDANPMVGTAGLNMAAPTRIYDYNAANRIVTGNVTGGAAFRGYSPIRDSNSLWLNNPYTGAARGSFGSLLASPSIAAGAVQPYSSLPSEQLTGFRRDTISVAEARQGYSFAGGYRPYYSPFGAVATTGGILSGVNRPGSSQLVTSYIPPREAAPGPADPILSDPATRGGALLTVPSQLVRVTDGRPLTGPVNERLLGSRLFGGVRSVPVTALKAEGAPGYALGTGEVAPMDTRVDRLDPLDRRLMLEERGLAVPGDAMVRPEGAQALDPAAGDLGSAAEQQGTVRDVFEELRGGLVRRPITPPEPQPPGDTIVRPLTEPKPQPGAQLPPAPADRTAPSESPLRTFVGTEQSALNRYLASAEQKLRSGQYYEAAATYEMARAIAPGNPLPLLGRAMALLAAGDYRTSANNLFIAIRLFDELAEHPLELQAFIPDVRALDRRRADLEQRLERVDDPQLRFLLGWAEYQSGLTREGLDDLRQAAEGLAEEYPQVARFVERLQQRHGAGAATRPAR